MELRCILFLSCLLAVLWSSSEAARRVDAGARARDTMRRRRESLLLKRDEPGELDSIELLQLTEGESMKERRKATDSHGTTVERMEEEYQGIPVFDSAVTVRKDEHGKLTGDASGVLIQDISEDLPDTTPKLTDEETLEIVIRTEGDDHWRNLIGDIEYSRFIFLDVNDKARLVNKVSYLIDGEKRPTYIIDMKSGDILKHWNSFMTLACCNETPLKSRIFGGNEKIGKIWYGSQPYCLDFTVDECNTCYLENKYVRVVDMNQTNNEAHNKTASFPCDREYGDEINGAYSPAIDAFFYGTIVGKMFEEWFGSSPHKDKITIRVHYASPWPTANWNGKNVTISDEGGMDFYPLVALDVIGHEIGHAVIEQGSGLLYFDESGGMDEAFADIMGETAEHFLLKSDWMIGHELTKLSDYLREFEDPENDNKSIKYAHQMTPEMDPHYSSGVYRRIWYVLIKEQEMETRTAFSLFKYANEMYWHHMSTFYDGSCGLLRAAMDLGVSTKPFAAAFEDVGIPKCNVSGHLYSLVNNKTQRGIEVNSISHPVFSFQIPAWGQSILIEAISPSGGPAVIQFKLYQDVLEDGDFDNAELIMSGVNKLTYLIDRQNKTDLPESEYRSVRNTTDPDCIPAKSSTYSPTVTNDETTLIPSSTSTDEVILNGTDFITETTTTPPQNHLDHYFIQLEPEWYSGSYNDVELTVGYTCNPEFDSDTWTEIVSYNIDCK